MRTRPLIWFTAGAVLTLVATLAADDAWTADAAPGDGDTTFVPITPFIVLGAAELVGGV
jgi:hypothetical protein